MDDWQNIARAKRDAVNSLIPEQWRFKGSIPSVEEQRDVTGSYIQQFLSPNEVEITESDAVKITQHTAIGHWKALDVTRAFCHRAALAHQLTNCLHEIFFEDAYAQARALDEYYATNKGPKGPLHGLPVSLKDQFHVKGVETSMGYVGWIGTFQGKKETNKGVFESEMVTELRAMGAILYCKTSVPHTLMSGETVNNIIGYCWCPKNRHLSSGGSSGGEGALISLRGSPVGFGTDIGGSIRIPAAFNGLYGLKPSGGRLPYSGMANSMDGQNTILSVVGPMSHSLDSLVLIIKSILSQQPWLQDPLVLELPWRQSHVEEIQQADVLNFGIFSHDKTVTPTPPVQRALKMTALAIQAIGHKTVSWDPPSHGKAQEICFSTWHYDGGADIHGAFGLSGEPISPQISGAYGTGPGDEMTGSAIAKVNVAKREFQKSYLDYWNSTKSITGGSPVDAIIAPVAPFPAARQGRYRYYGYSTFLNTLDYPACVIPVTQVNAEVDVVDPRYEPIGEEDKAVWESYDPQIYDGAYVGLQIIGRRLQEEKVLQLARIVSEALAKQGSIR